MTSIYIIGSLANPEIPRIAAKLREEGFDAFDQWHAVGPEGDKWWQEHFKAKGYNLAQSLKMDFVQTAFNFDKKHLDRCEAAVLVLPAGKSGHLELGYCIGRGKPGFILMEGDPDRYDLMYGFATLCYSMEDLIDALNTPAGFMDQECFTYRRIPPPDTPHAIGCLGVGCIGDCWSCGGSRSLAHCAGCGWLFENHLEDGSCPK